MNKILPILIPVAAFLVVLGLVLVIAIPKAPTTMAVKTPLPTPATAITAAKTPTPTTLPTTCVIIPGAKCLIKTAGLRKWGNATSLNPADFFGVTKGGEIITIEVEKSSGKYQNGIDTDLARVFARFPDGGACWVEHVPNAYDPVSPPPASGSTSTSPTSPTTPPVKLPGGVPGFLFVINLLVTIFFLYYDFFRKIRDEFKVTAQVDRRYVKDFPNTGQSSVEATFYFTIVNQPLWDYAKTVTKIPEMLKGVLVSTAAATIPELINPALYPEYAKRALNVANEKLGQLGLNVGINFTDCVITNINPPRSFQEAMDKQSAAAARGAEAREVVKAAGGPDQLTVEETARILEALGNADKNRGIGSFFSGLEDRIIGLVTNILGGRPTESTEPPQEPEAPRKQSVINKVLNRR